MAWVILQWLPRKVSKHKASEAITHLMMLLPAEMAVPTSDEQDSMEEHFGEGIILQP
jgi:hypothetical protein